MRIQRYEITFDTDPDKQDPLWKSPARGAIMHGILMSNINPNLLHSGVSSLRPYTQNIKAVEYGKYIWLINILDSNLCSEILNWLSLKPKKIYSSHYDCEFTITAIEKTFDDTYSQLLSSSMNNDFSRFATFQFLTPVIFKKARSSQYSPYPDMQLILNSLLNKWNAFSDSEKFLEEEINNDLMKMAHLKDFTIRGSKISMDGVNLTGSKGFITMTLSGEKHSIITFHLLGKYAEFCGIGAKTAMGLGCVKYSDELRKRIKKPNLLELLSEEYVFEE